jgi:hypothetical protein
MGRHGVPAAEHLTSSSSFFLPNKYLYLREILRPCLLRRINQLTTSPRDPRNLTNIALLVATVCLHPVSTTTGA